MFYNDHKEADNGAACAVRIDNPTVAGKPMKGKWKIFFNDSLTRFGKASAVELFELSSDPMESKNRVAEKGLNY